MRAPRFLRTPFHVVSMDCGSLVPVLSSVVFSYHAFFACSIDNDGMPERTNAIEQYARRKMIYAAMLSVLRVAQGDLISIVRDKCLYLKPAKHKY